jgi:hypothetical protein
VQDGGCPLENEVYAEKTEEIDRPQQNRGGGKATLKQGRNEMTLVCFFPQDKRFREPQPEHGPNRKREQTTGHENGWPTEKSYKTACQQPSQGKAGPDAQARQNHQSSAGLCWSKVCGECNGEGNAAAEAQPGWKSKRRQVERRGRKCRHQRKHSEYNCAADQHGLASQPIAEQSSEQRTDQQPHITRGQDRSESLGMNLPHIDEGWNR